MVCTQKDLITSWEDKSTHENVEFENKNIEKSEKPVASGAWTYEKQFMHKDLRCLKAK